MDKTLLSEIQATAELCGAALSKGALDVLSGDLESYQAVDLRAALKRCRREHKGRLTVEAIVSRIDDGHPGPEEAWAMMPRSESATVVWTSQMAESWGIASPLLEEGDAVAARMAFKEHYVKAVQASRDTGVPPKWRPSLGHDLGGRESVILAAVEKGRLGHEHAQTLLPHGAFTEQLPALPSYVTDLTKRLQ